MTTLQDIQTAITLARAEAAYAVLRLLLARMDAPARHALVAAAHDEARDIGLADISEEICGLFDCPPPAT